MQEVLLVIHLIVAIFLIGLVLMQRSEGGALGIGGGGGGNLFSSRGVGNTLTRTTAILAVAFFATSILLTVLATRRGSTVSPFETAPAGQQTAPATGATGTDTGKSVLPQLPASDGTPKVPVTP
ncbi:MAG: preprotein translocase subunit SecG [Rhizobiales bacterium]|nr:preprotein translocase subunit SecG [Hyphomicrobiales bacterium]MBI3672927.1 preprotein translocase subunit SecG [Hyphomicrobiales bacterium]